MYTCLILPEVSLLFRKKCSRDFSACDIREKLSTTEGLVKIEYSQIVFILLSTSCLMFVPLFGSWRSFNLFESRLERPYESFLDIYESTLVSFGSGKLHLYVLYMPKADESDLKCRVLTLWYCWVVIGIRFCSFHRQIEGKTPTITLLNGDGQ